MKTARSRVRLHSFYAQKMSKYTRRIFPPPLFSARALYVRAQIRLARETRFTIRRTATRRGAVLATICEHSNAHESRRAARIDPSSKLAARCGAADAARPIK